MIRVSSGGAVLSLVALAFLACGERPGGDEREGHSAEPPPALVAVGEEAGLALDSATRTRLGIRVETLARASEAPELELPGMVVEDPGAITLVRAGVSGRLSVVAGRSWPAIGERLEAGEVVAQVGDARPIPVPRAGTVTRLLAQPGELVQAGQELLALTDFSTAVIRLTWTGPGAAPARIRFVTTGGGRGSIGQLEGPAPAADPLTRAPAMLYRVRGAPGLRPGVAVAGLVPDASAPRGGVMIPARAVVQWDALAWVYAERAPGRFVRVHVPTDHPVPGGWLVSGGLEPGDRVVTAGAALLLSEEFRARITVGEEVGE